MKIKVTYERVFEPLDIYEEDHLKEMIELDEFTEEGFLEGILMFLEDSPEEMFENLEFDLIKE